MQQPKTEAVEKAYDSLPGLVGAGLQQFLHIGYYRPQVFHQFSLVTSSTSPSVAVSVSVIFIRSSLDLQTDTHHFQFSSPV